MKSAYKMRRETNNCDELLDGYLVECIEEYIEKRIEDEKNDGKYTADIEFHEHFFTGNDEDSINPAFTNVIKLLQLKGYKLEMLPAKYSFTISW